MDDLRLIWSGPLDGTTAEQFRASATTMLDRARAAQCSLQLDLSAAHILDYHGIACIVAMGRTAHALRVPVRIDRPSLIVTEELDLAAALDLFDWPTS